MATPGPAPMISEAELHQFIEQYEEPFVTARIVAQSKGIAQKTALKHLNRLHNNGKIKKKRVGATATIWWPEPRCD